MTGRKLTTDEFHEMLIGFDRKESVDCEGLRCWDCKLDNVCERLTIISEILEKELDRGK